MARILFMMDFAKGHLLPTFGTAQEFLERGHRVGYAVIPDLEETVWQGGFEVVSIFQDLYPAGTLARLKGGQSPLETDGLSDHWEPLLEGFLDEQIRAWKPDLIIASYFIPLEALILHVRYDLPMAILTPYLRPALLSPAELALEKLIKAETMGFKLLEVAMAKGQNIRKMRQLVEPLDDFPELICCPPEFDVSTVDRGPRVHYIGPSMRLGRGGVANPERDAFLHGLTGDLAGGKSLIYASLGSEIETYREVGARFFSQLFELAGSKMGENLFFLVSLGSCFEHSRLGEVPANVRVCHWVPQMAILERAVAAMTHGGLGTIKECIWHGVPMVVLPVGRDQPENADRVRHHQLGKVVDVEEMTTVDLANALRQVLEEETISQAVGNMKDLFRRREEQRIGVRLLEEILSPVPELSQAMT